MKKKILGIILSISGILGFIVILGGVNFDGYFSLFIPTVGILVLVIVVFLGVPRYQKMNF